MALGQAVSAVLVSLHYSFPLLRAHPKEFAAESQRMKSAAQFTLVDFRTSSRTMVMTVDSGWNCTCDDESSVAPRVEGKENKLKCER